MLLRDVLRTLGAILVSLALAACGSTDEEPRTPPEGGTPSDASEEPGAGDAPGSSERAFVFETGELEIEPGGEKYVCWTTNLPDEETVITGISAEYGPATHHVFLAWTLAPEPEGLSECPVLFKTTWIPLYLGGVNTSPLVLPEGAGIELEADQQLLLQLHLQNTTPDPIKNRVRAYLHLGDATQEHVPAGIYGLDNHAIRLPPQSQDVETSMTCEPGRDMEVFSVLGHMHKLGDHLWLKRNGSVLFEQPWFFDEQPITPVDFRLGADDQLELGCRHDNPLDKTVEYGESSDTEMCALVLYYTPYDRLDGCIHAPATSAD